VQSEEQREHAWSHFVEKGSSLRNPWDGLFQEALEQAKSDQESLEYLSMIDFAVDGYANMSASRAYPDNPVLQNWAINGYMLAWREHFLKDQEEEDFTEVV
jgi:hypothetical protein